MSLRNLFLATTVVAISAGSAGMAAAEGMATGLQAPGHEMQMEGALDVRPVAGAMKEMVGAPYAPEVVTAAPYRSDSARALIATVQSTAPAMACRMPGSPARANVPFCSPATSLAPASAARPVMVW